MEATIIKYVLCKDSVNGREFQRPSRVAGGLGGDEGAAKGFRSLLTGRDKYLANSLPCERRMSNHRGSSNKGRAAAYFGFKVLPRNGFGGAEGHQHQRLIGGMVCIGAIGR
jgi:hypothetical protein